MTNSGFSNIFENCIQNLHFAEKQLEDKDVDKGDNMSDLPDLHEFWNEIGILTKKLSFACTKICASFSGNPLPNSEAASSLLHSIEELVFTLVSTILKLPPSAGKTFSEKLVSCSIFAVSSSRQLICTIKDEGGGALERYRQATGVCWEGCKLLESCPKNNKEAVLNRLRVHSSLINDAFDEISEGLEGDGKGWDNFGGTISDEEDLESEISSPSWSDDDKHNMKPSINIIKAAKSLLSKTLLAVEKHGKTDTVQRIQELDHLFEDCDKVPQMIDSLILEMYPPLNIANMELMTNALSCQLLSVLKTAVKSHMVTEDEQKSFDFLKKAVEHNINKMKEILRNL